MRKIVLLTLLLSLVFWKGALCGVPNDSKTEQEIEHSIAREVADRVKEEERENQEADSAALYPAGAEQQSEPEVRDEVEESAVVASVVDEGRRVAKVGLGSDILIIAALFLLAIAAITIALISFMSGRKSEKRIFAIESRLVGFIDHRDLYEKALEYEQKLQKVRGEFKGELLRIEDDYYNYTMKSSAASVEEKAPQEKIEPEQVGPKEDIYYANYRPSDDGLFKDMVTRQSGGYLFKITVYDNSEGYYELAALDDLSPYYSRWSDILEIVDSNAQHFKTLNSIRTVRRGRLIRRGEQWEVDRGELLKVEVDYSL